MDKFEEELHFFDYLNLIKKEFRNLTEKYPELSKLSHRELEVFFALLSDKTQIEIAESLYVTPSTVHFHTKNIYKKLGISSRMQLLIHYRDICPV